MDSYTQFYQNAGEGPITRPLAFFCLTSILGGITHGYHTGVLNNPKTTITNCTEFDIPPDQHTFALPPCFRIDDALWGTIVGMYAIGGVIGSIASGRIADWIGRKSLIFYNNFFLILGSLLTSLAVDESMMVIGRIILGVGGGVSTVVIPLYLNEISPTNYRGALGVLNQLSITIGISFSQILGLFMSFVPGWRWLIGISCFFNLAQMIMIYFCPQTPRWLVMKNRNEEAYRVLRNIRGPTAEESANGEFQIMLDANEELDGRSTTLKSFFANKNLLRPLMIAAVLQVSQQLSGIYAVFYYSTDIFNKIDSNHSEILTVTIGIVNVLMTIVSGALVDRAGRRPLLLIGEIGLVITGVIFTIAFSLNVSWLLAICTYIYVSFFAFSIGPLAFIVLNEIFPTNAVATASSLAMSLNWGCNYLVGQFFPLMSSGMGGYSFLPFVFILLFSVIFVYKYVPETKGRSLDEIGRKASIVREEEL